MTTSDLTSASISARGSAPRSLGANVIAFTRQTWAGLRVLLALTLLLGIGYPLVVTGVGQLVFPWQANGSLLAADGSHVTSAAGSAHGPAIGSALIGQGFSGPTWFHPRPSAAGAGYDTLASGGSNLGPTNPTLLATVQERRATVAAEDGVDPSTVPPDAVTASASGLDPDISPAYAREQVARVAAARGLPVARVAALVEQHVQGRTLGILGEPRVDVLALNLALTTMAP
ncbi:potassium-transporting ATPase C chain [mine drainage metagenome]|uniref:Potassium-transporting ATPase C chain n=1 Tax=mine drainage metagenome TaxID=410659 RepID=A0A1J5R2S7_9ZZZZ